MGIVYHTHYIDYFEAARTEALRALGMSYKDLEDTGIFMPVVDLAVHYHRPTEYDDMLEITARFNTESVARFRVDYEIRRAGDPELLVSGQTTLCYFDKERNRPIRAPKKFYDLLNQTQPA